MYNINKYSWLQGWCVVVDQSPSRLTIVPWGGMWRSIYIAICTFSKRLVVPTRNVMSYSSHSWGTPEDLPSFSLLDGLTLTDLSSLKYGRSFTTPLLTTAEERTLLHDKSQCIYQRIWHFYAGYRRNSPYEHISIFAFNTNILVCASCILR